MSQDYYQILGVARTATVKEIKAAYRKLASTEHPDKHGGSAEAVAKFQEINGAYEILRDPDKRKEYDLQSSGGARQAPVGGRAAQPNPQAAGGRTGGTRPAGGAAPGAEFNDIFASMFGGAGGRRSQAGGASRTGSATTGPATAPGPSPSAPAGGGDYKLDISLEEAFHGAQRTFKVNTEDVCPDCNGTGVSQKGRTGLQPGTMCLTCRGAGRKRRMEEVPVNVPPGIYEGAKLRLKGKGAPDARGQRTDLFLTVHLKKHDQYTLEGSDLILDVPAPYTAMVLGGEIQVPTLAGDKPLTIPPGTPSGRKLKLPGLGMPALGSRSAGDLYARLNVAIPKTITPEERHLLIELQKEESKAGRKG